MTEKSEQERRARLERPLKELAADDVWINSPEELRARLAQKLMKENVDENSTDIMSLVALVEALEEGRGKMDRVSVSMKWNGRTIDDFDVEPD